MDSTPDLRVPEAGVFVQFTEIFNKNLGLRLAAMNLKKNYTLVIPLKLKNNKKYLFVR